MMTQPHTDLTVNEALKILTDYSCFQIKVIDVDFDQKRLRQAIQLITSLSDSQNIGICADNFQEGWKALISYLNALDYFPQLEKDSLVPGEMPVYIKFNTDTMSYYVDSYTGSYRGVLISCQSENRTLVGTYGHFPLNLFE